MAGAPNSYNDPFWVDLAGRTEQRLDLPSGLLVGVLTKGERSNADQVSEAGARTPFQIIPATRRAAIDKYGVDPYLSPENAAEVAGKLLKDSLERNKGNPVLAVAEYHGGTNRDNWGPRTKAYAKRVVGMSPDHPDAASAAPAPASQAGSTFDRVSKRMGFNAVPESAIANVFAAYQGDQMSADEAKAFEEDVRAGHVMLPRGAALNADRPSTPDGAQPGGNVLPASVVAAYHDGRMSEDERMQLESDLDAGIISLPTGAQVGKTERPGMIDNIKESITGDKRRTAATEAALDWASMPELNSFTLASAKTSMGTLLSNPQETVQIIQSNFPGVQVNQDDRGNYFLRSSIDGKDYAIKPGFRPSDIPRAAAGVAAFTPAGRATSILGASAAAAGTQAAIEGSQAIAGGEFNPSDVAIAGITGGAVQGAGNLVRAAAAPAHQLLQRIQGVPNPIPPVPIPAPSAAPAAAVPMPAADLAETARTAAQGGMGSNRATQVLAGQAAPDAKVVAAAKRLGIHDYLQPDHVTTNQAFRELAQAVKSIPGSEARAAEMNGLERVAKRADDLIEEIGGTHDASVLNVNVKKNLQATYDEIKAKAGSLYDEVRANVPAKSEAPATTVLDMISARADELGGVKNLSSMERMINAKLAPKAAKAAPGEEMPAPRAPTYALLDDVRRDLTAAKYSRQGPFKDSDDRLITMLEGALRKDQQAAAERFGMGTTWDLAQKTASSYKAIQDDLSALFGKNLDESLVGDLSGAVRALPAGDPTKFIRLVRAVPESMRQEVVASGLSTAFGMSAKRGNISFNSYAHWYEGLVKNQRSYAALMSNLPAPARKQLSDLYRVSSSISAATRERITTGRINSIKDDLKGADSLVARLYDTAKRSAVGAVVGTAATPLIGPGAAAAIASAFVKGAKPEAIKSVDALISSPAFIALAKQGTQTPTRGGTLRLVHSQAFRQFARAVGQHHDPSAAEKWVTQAMQSNNRER